MGALPVVVGNHNRDHTAFAVFTDFGALGQLLYGIGTIALPINLLQLKLLYKMTPHGGTL